MCFVRVSELALLNHFCLITHALFFAGIGWRAEVHPRTHPVNELEFDVIIGADGRRNTLPGKLPCTDQRNAFVK